MSEKCPECNSMMYKLFGPYNFRGLIINTESYSCVSCDCTIMTQRQVSKTNWQLSSKALELVDNVQSENSELKSQVKELTEQIEKLTGTIDRKFEVGNQVKVSRPMKLFDGEIGEIVKINQDQDFTPVKVYFKEYNDTCWYDFTELTKV